MAHLGPGPERHLTVRAMRLGVGLGRRVVNNVGGGFQHAPAGVADLRGWFEWVLAEPADEAFYKEGHVAMLSRTAFLIKTNTPVLPNTGDSAAQHRPTLPTLCE